MPPRAKAAAEDAPAPTEPERRSTRIRDAPPKPAPAAAPAAKAEKKVKKADPALEEYRPSGAKKAANKKRKKADVEKEEAAAEGKGTDAVEEESKPKKKTKTETKTAAAAKEKKVEEAKEEPTTTRTERRKSGVVTVQPTIEEANEAKAEEVALVLGAMLPQMKVKNEKGEEIEVSTLATDTGVVIFTAPKADTPGCNKQACHFRDSTDEFTKLGYTVYALTADTPAALSKWQSKNTLGYSLLSDPKREFISRLGAKSANTTKRSHFVFERGTGKLLDAQIGVKPDSSHSAALKFVKSL